MHLASLWRLRTGIENKLGQWWSPREGCTSTKAWRATRCEPPDKSGGEPGLGVSSRNNHMVSGKDMVSLSSPDQPWTSCIPSFCIPSTQHSSWLSVQWVLPNIHVCQWGHRDKLQLGSVIQVLLPASDYDSFASLLSAVVGAVSVRLPGTHEICRFVVDLSLESCGLFPTLISLHDRGVKFAKKNKKLLLH